jgi:hypothetical protein
MLHFETLNVYILEMRKLINISTSQTKGFFTLGAIVFHYRSRLRKLPEDLWKINTPQATRSGVNSLPQSTTCL